MRILNLGCGTKVSQRPDVVNVDWSMYLRLRRMPLSRYWATLLLSGERLERFRNLPDNVLVHDLSLGIPFDSGSVDVVYHSHLLEHLDRPIARTFLAENLRVLKAGGTLRIVVPDLELAVRSYLAHIAECDADAAKAESHDAYIGDIIEQSVRREAYGTGRQRPLRRRAERLLLGDARRRGETHQWMYDRINLGRLLAELGYVDITLRSYDTSRVPDWNAIF